jgi:hypothetical protein
MERFERRSFCSGEYGVDPFGASLEFARRVGTMWVRRGAAASNGRLLPD